MMRFVARTTIALIANAIGLIVAAAILDEMSLSSSGFILDVVIFTAIVAISQPFIAKSSIRGGSALVGASALVASLVALLLTVWWSDGLRISGFTTWVLATLIVWAAAVLAGVLLPVVLFKKWLRAGAA